MNKVVIIVVSVIAVLALAFGIAGFIRAEKFQDQSNSDAWIQQGLGFGKMGARERNDFGPGMMNQQDDDFGSGMMGGRRGNDAGRGLGVMQEYQFAALAEKMGMSEDDLTARMKDGNTILDLAADKGMSVKEFITFQEETRIVAIDKALAAGVISQNQADAMKESNYNGMMGGFGCR